MKTVREQVVDLLIEVEREQSYAQLSLKKALVDLEMRDKALATEIFYGTIKYQIQIDYWLNQYSKTPIRKMKPLIRNLLRMSVYQMLHLDKIPVSAVINEAVKITKKRKFQGLSGFVNGLLRTIDREREKLAYPSEKDSLSEALSIQYAIPEWMIKMWLKQYSRDIVEQIASALNQRAEVCGRVNDLKGSKAELLEILEKEGVHVEKQYSRDIVEQIASALNQRAEVCGRVNDLKGSKAELLEILEKEGVHVESGHLLEEAFYLKKVDNLQNLPSFKLGAWTVQDESAMLVAHVVAPKAGEYVLDMCSAPGGKSMHMAAKMENRGEIIACDIHPHKLELIEKNAKRLGISIIKPTLQDGMVLNENWIGKFDKVLLDAPCSGLGIMKRKPDIRLHKTKDDLKEIVEIQKALFKNAVQYLKPNGKLVYSTCTISYEENELIIKEAISEYGLELENIVDTIPKLIQSSVKEQGMIQILPNMAGTDGFFIASLKRRSF